MNNMIFVLAFISTLTIRARGRMKKKIITKWKIAVKTFRISDWILETKGTFEEKKREK